METLIVALMLCQAAVNPPVPPAEIYPPNWYGAGAAWNQMASPQINGWASYAHLLTAKGPVYSFTSWDVTSAKSPDHKFTPQTSTRTGLATVIRKIGPVTVIGLVDGGMAAASSNVSGAFSGGGVGIITLGKSSWNIVVGAKFLTTPLGGKQAAYQFGFGKSYGASK